MTAFSVKQESFEGPLHVLIDLLKSKKLEITSINLADIAEDYLAFLEQGEISANDLADFLQIASKLIYLKSRELFPSIAPEELDDISLEEQLRIYQLYLDASKKIQGLMSSADISFKRKQPKKKAEWAFSPSKNLTASNLDKAFKAMTKRLQPFFSLQETSMQKVQSVEEKMTELRKKIEGGVKKLSFASLVKGAESKAEIVVSFLAVLELVRRQVLIASQSEHAIILSHHES